jgi:molybdopterin-biosynthesis enzyme MoeA-like protein
VDIREDLKNHKEWRDRIERKLDKASQQLDQKMSPINQRLWIIVGGANALAWAVGIIMGVLALCM